MFKLKRTLFGTRIGIFRRTIIVGYIAVSRAIAEPWVLPNSAFFFFFFKEKEKAANICPSLRIKISCSDLYGKSTI